MKHIPFETEKYYHLFNRGNNRENIFIEDRNYSFFLTKVKHYLLPILDVYCYCLLPNHFHMVIQIKEKDVLPIDYQIGKKQLYQAFSNCFNSYSKSINKAYNRTGSLFQEHLHRIEINNEQYFKDVILYTHLNPVNHKLSEDFRDYPYSSYKAYLSMEPTELKRDDILELFGGLENFVYCHEERKYINQNKLEEIEGLDG